MKVQVLYRVDTWDKEGLSEDKTTYTLISKPLASVLPKVTFTNNHVGQGITIGYQVKDSKQGERFHFTVEDGLFRGMYDAASFKNPTKSSNTLLPKNYFVYVRFSNPEQVKSLLDLQEKFFKFVATLKGIPSGFKLNEFVKKSVSNDFSVKMGFGNLSNPVLVTDKDGNVITLEDTQKEYKVFKASVVAEPYYYANAEDQASFGISFSLRHLVIDTQYEKDDRDMMIIE